MAEQETVVSMNWLHVTERLAREFRLPGCFVLDREKDEWVGTAPPQTFRNYLKGLFKAKEAAYFDTIRFYKYKDEAKDETLRYLALIPVSLKAVPYQFMGLLYESPERLQELLRFRIMPNYTLFWLYQLVAEARLRNTDQGAGQRALLKALEEQRVYSERLESKVHNLRSVIDSVKNAEISLEERADRLAQLLEEQTREYTELAENYQSLFDAHQQLQEEYLSTAVTLETRLSELESKEVARAITDEEEKPGVDKEKSASRLRSLMDRLGQSQQRLIALQQEYETMRAGYGDLSPTQVKQLVGAMSEMRRQLDYYKRRSNEQESLLKRYKAQALASRRGQTPNNAT